MMTSVRHRTSSLLFLIVGLAGMVGCSTTSSADKSTSSESAAETSETQEAEASSKKGATETEPGPGFLVVAPDRGFLGNDQIRDIFEEFAASRIAELVFVTDDSTHDRLDEGLAALTDAGAESIHVVPLFVSVDHARFQLARDYLDATASERDIALEYARPLGETYLGVEMLSDHLRQIEQPAGKKVVVVGHGARSEESREAMDGDLRRIADRAGKGFGFASVDAVVWHDWRVEGAGDLKKTSQKKLAEATGGENVVVVPFHLGSKLDGMMQFDKMLHHRLRGKAEVLDVAMIPNPMVGMWMRREANRVSPLDREDVGVLLLAHGADFEWNERMREAVRPLEEKYTIEYAFTMADRDVMARAVNKLEERGARAIVVVRVFGLASSFRGSVERMIGMDVEGDGKAGGHGGHGHGHGGHGPRVPPKRIRSAATMTTLGGLEDSPLFAEALADRVREISEEPSRETVILLAHGIGSDTRNAHWLELLGSLTEQMQQHLDGEYRGFEYGTWREDWPDARKEWVPKIRGMVEDASAGDGRALVIPARTNGTGPSTELLEGYEYTLGRGFAPHPLFADWVEGQIEQGIERLK